MPIKRPVKKAERKLYKKALKNLMGLGLIFPAFQVLADTGESPVGEGLSYVVDHLIYGADGMIIATLAIAGVGLACLKHTIEWRYFFYTLGGIAIIFGAPAIVSGIKSLVSV